MMPGPHFEDWFAKLTGHKSPWAWQQELAGAVNCRDRLIRIPTGLGKTEGILAVWLFHQLQSSAARWPRRLVWCLPMRVLVDQTAEVARRLRDSLPELQRPTVHVVMGGEDAGDWSLHPEHPAILVGTQDMLLSRALNRGYASARARWPMEFGLLNHDALWVMDEVQLMDVGLATSAQLQAFRQEDRGKQLRPCHTWWMSATLQPEWLKSVDTASYHESWADEPCRVRPDQRRGGPWDVRKTLATAAIGVAEADRRAFARRILAGHAELRDGEYGRITLVVCNTVKRACETFDELRSLGRTDGLELVHGRFRPGDRGRWKLFLSRSACTSGADRIIVATQVVEAGVDLSAGCLISELAPWPGLVQRFGRCARYGGEGSVVVVDRGRNEDAAAPYSPDELESAWETLQNLGQQGVGIAVLEGHEESLGPEARARLYPYEPAHLLMRREFDELFDTTPDLTGADLDISRFLRTGEDRDLQVFWVKVPKGEDPPPGRRPLRDELCAVSYLQARNWLCGTQSKTKPAPRLKNGMRAWIWDWLDGGWKIVDRAGLLPGRVVLVAASCGGYRPDRGFDPESRAAVPPLVDIAEADVDHAFGEADDRQDGEPLSAEDSWKTIACHASEVAAEARAIAESLGLSPGLSDLLDMAARWHDWGKSHPAFQGAIRAWEEPPPASQAAIAPWKRPDRRDLAKGPRPAWRKPPSKMYRFGEDREHPWLKPREQRPAFRHELASALGLFGILETYAPRHPALLGPWAEVFAAMGGEPIADDIIPGPPTPLIRGLLELSAESFDLVAYLVASHHGKVRVGLHAAPADQDYRPPSDDDEGMPIRGVREKDRLPSIVLVPGEPPVPEVSLTLSPAAVGLSERTGRSWRERCQGLLERHGPGGLAFLEAILRAADVRASRKRTSDPALASEADA